MDTFHKNLLARGKGSKARPNAFTEVEYLGGNRFAVSIISSGSIKSTKRTVYIDPSVSLSDPTEDGFIVILLWNGTLYIREDDAAFIQIGRQDPDVNQRGYVEWDISSIPDSATITNTVFKYHGDEDYPIELDCHIHEMLGARPSTSEDQAVYDEAGEGIVYANPAGFPEVGTNKQVDLGASADSHLQSQLSADWFAIGIQSDIEATVAQAFIFAEDHAAATPPPTLYVEYTMPIVAPTVTTQAANGIGCDSPSAHATLHGTITDTGWENPGERGFDYDYDSGAPYAYSWTETDSYGVGAFSHQVTGLTEEVTVYFRAKAHNSAGWGYGGELSFKTPKAWTKILTENLGLVDTYSRVWTIYRTHSELLGLADTVSKGVQLHPLTETLGLSDVLTKEPGKMLTESLGLVDFYSRTWNVCRTYSELLGLADTTITIFRLSTKVLTELLGLSDTVIKSPSIVKAESLGLVDTYSRTWNAYRTYSELLGLADPTVTAFKILTKVLTEILGLKDTVLKAPSITRTELLGLVDTYSRVWGACRTYTESLGLVDTVVKDIGLPLTETLGLLDTFSRTWAVQRTYTETLGLKDTFFRQWGIYRTYTEVLGLLDTVLAQKNPVVLAKLIGKLVRLTDLEGVEDMDQLHELKLITGEFRRLP